MTSPRPNLYRRLTASVPLLVTVIIHVVLVAIAGYFVTEQVLGKKKTFSAAAAADPSVAQKQVEHRLQVARKGGGSASSSPVSASRIFSTAENALQMPAMPDLPSVGASSLSGMGFGKGMGAAGTGTGYSTGLGSTGGLGRGFMSMSFLGVTNQRSSKVVFAVDISPSLMDIRKGGFRAFEILRHEISRLVSTLPPAHSFNVVLFDGGNIRLFASELKPANVANKTEFFDWIKPINASLSSLGGSSIPSSSPRWTFKRDEALKLDPEFGPSSWVHAIHAALEQKPDTIFLITGSGGAGQTRYSQETIDRRKRARAEQLAELKAQGVDFAAINTARSKAFSKLRAEFDEINRQLVAKKKDPFVITHTQRILDADMQAAIRKAGFTPPKLDYTGWTNKKGEPIWDDFSGNVGTSHNAEFTDVISHVSKLQYGLLSERAALNIFLFVGPDEKPEATQKNLSALTGRNGGKFTLLTTKRLEELSKRAENEAP
ncbi:MAG: hypothetical protein K0R17_1843 [Rariglobus sp.]|jgi:hypothetical protein|nr:hypothetical protein [Rariglobus sp.]